MQHAQVYSFKSPLSFSAIRERLRDVGPWQWIETGDQSVTANLPMPDRGTVKIMVRAGVNIVEVAAESKPENMQAIYDTVFVHVLPAISASDVKQGIETPEPQSKTIYRSFAYTFDSPVAFKDLCAKLNSAGPWEWYERENDRLDDYLLGIALSSPNKGQVRIITTHGRYLVDVYLRSAEPDATSLIENAERELFDRVLPSIGAHALAKTEPLD